MPKTEHVIDWGKTAAEIGEEYTRMAQENEKLRNLLNELLAQEGMHDRDDGNAPGHCHEVPGVWDSDNGKKAGKPCAWCALWAEAKASILMHTAAVSGRGETKPDEKDGGCSASG